MNHEPEPAAEAAERPDSMLVLALLALVAGAASGALGAVFRLMLERSDPAQLTFLQAGDEVKITQPAIGRYASVLNPGDKSCP